MSSAKFPYSHNPSWWMILEFPKSHQRYIESRVALQKHCEDIFGQITILLKKWKHEIRNEKCCWGQKSINLLEKAPFKSRPAEFEYWFFDRLTSHFPHWILSTGILTHCASWHLSNILQGSPAKGESTLCPALTLTLPLFFPAAAKRSLLRLEHSPLSSAPRAFWASPWLQNLPGEKSFGPELCAAWLAAWAVVVCFKQRILKGKHGQTKPRLKTQERRGEQTRGFCACARLARPATRQQLPEEEEEVKALPGRRTCFREWQQKPPVFFLLGPARIEPGLHDENGNKQTNKQMTTKLQEHNKLKIRNQNTR